MTTIAFDGRYLAADTYVWQGDSVTAEVAKIKIGAIGGAKGLREYVVASCGHPAALHQFIRDYNSVDYPMRPEMPTGEGTRFDAIVIFRDGEILFYDEVYRYPDEATPFSGTIALGSGGDFAKGAMVAGAHAQQAVKIAIGCHAHSGGSVNVFDTKEWKFISEIVP